MGQVCSSTDRKKQKFKHSDFQAEPPPYTDYGKFKPTRASPSSKFNKKDGDGGAPDMNLHPALRNLHASRPSSASPGIKLPTRPAPTHSRGHSFLHTFPLSSPLPEYSTHRISANSVPQWRWTNSQCRTWITDVLIVYGGKDAQTARNLARTFRGFGPNLYMKEWKQWNAWLGADGQAIFALLVEVHDEEGAVPREVEIAHYRREGLMLLDCQVDTAKV